MAGFVYILECSNGSFYTGSTKNISVRLTEHQEGRGSRYTEKFLPVTLVYLEEYQRIDDAYYRELQIKGWRRAKKLALINGNPDLLPALAKKYGLNKGS
ncbi:MAG: putative endonuclease [Flavobacteriales bacterium]